MDVSGSVGAQWYYEQDFVKKLAQVINISPAGGHAAVTIFSSNIEGNHSHPAAELKIKFSDHNMFSSFKKAVNGLPYWGGLTRIDKALDVARKEMFHQSNGMRPNAPKTLVLITDGQQSGLDYTELAKSFRKDKIRVIVIGVGDVNTEELLDLVDLDSDLHLAKDFDALLKGSFLKSITLCGGMLLCII